MKYCVHYHRNSPFRYFDELAEIEINYRREDTTLPAFLEKYADKTIIITIDKVDEFLEHNDIDRIAGLYEKYKNIKLRFSFTNKELFELVSTKHIPFFFADLIDNWDTLIGVLALNPTDVYIVNDLGFSLKQIAEIVHARKINIRCIPNVAQSTWNDTPPIKKFFIRPEDIPFYDEYVDVFEFAGEDKNKSVYYEVYAHDGKWFGKLNEIILDFNAGMDSRAVVPAFAFNRAKCDKRCNKGSGCQICERVEHLAETLADQEMLIPVRK